MATKVKPIRSKRDHKAALKEVDRVWGAKLGTPEGDRLDVLHYAIAELGHTQAELAELLGSRSRASEILARRRALTVEMIHTISQAWKILAELLVRPYKTERAA